MFEKKYELNSEISKKHMNAKKPINIVLSKVTINPLPMSLGVYRLNGSFFTTSFNRIKESK